MPDESTARVALATCAQVPDLDRDTKTLLSPLARIGIDVHAAVWSDCRVDWGQYDLTVVRSCWDYHENRDRVLAWARPTTSPESNMMMARPGPRGKS
jgi:hypothetical protein